MKEMSRIELLKNGLGGTKVEFDINPKYLNEQYTVTLPTDNLTSCLAILSSVSSKKFRLKNNVIVLE